MPLANQARNCSIICATKLSRNANRKVLQLQTSVISAIQARYKSRPTISANWRYRTALLLTFMEIAQNAKRLRYLSTENATRKLRIAYTKAWMLQVSVMSAAMTSYWTTTSATITWTIAFPIAKLQKISVASVKTILCSPLKILA